jgi:hypothetical protein
MPEKTKAEPKFGLCLALRYSALRYFSDCSSAADEVHDDGDHGEEE